MTAERAPGSLLGSPAFRDIRELSGTRACCHLGGGGVASWISCGDRTKPKRAARAGRCERGNLP
jgi:hypothetical protein